MRRNRALKRGRVVWIIAAGGIGYLLGGWHITTSPKADVSAAQTIALRFPEDQPTAPEPDGSPTNTISTAGAMVLGDPQLGLLNPAPMTRQAVAQPAPQAAVQTAPAETVSSLPTTAPPRRATPTIQPSAQAKQPTAAHRRAERSGFMLNDAQIASIKGRLNLTPDQERMWPGVEAALRNIAYAKAHDAHRHGATASAEVAALNPESNEVQDLKSAAFPLIMSFNEEQKNEVRSLAHVMGLDNLASAF